MHDKAVFTGKNTDFFGINKEKEKLQQYLDLTGAIMVMIGPEQNIIFVNKTGCEILGYSREGIIGKNWFDNYVCVKDRPAAKQAFLKIMAGNMGEAEFVESCMLTKSGEERRIAWHNNPIRDNDGKITAFISSGEDVTGRREIENGLEKTRIELAATKISEDAAREYAESMINTIREPLIALDQDLRIVSASRSFYEFFKVKPAETIGQLIYDLGNKQWDIPKLRELLETILPQKATFNNYVVEHDFATIGRRIMLLNARQIQRASGKERIILLAIEDITVRREIENGLEKIRIELAATKISEDAAREYAESMINTIREPLIALDQDLRIVTASRSFYEFFKVKPADTVGQLIYDLGNKQWDIPKLRELLETILPQKTTFNNYVVEHDFVTIGRRIMLLNARQIQRASGKERIILLAIEDITERREIENGLEKARKELVTTKISEDAAREYAESMINTIREPLIALDQDLRIVTASRSFYKFFKVKPADTVGQLIYDLGNKQWDIPKLRELLETILPQKTTFDNYEVEHDFVTIGRRIMLLNARQIQRVLGKERIILLAIEDITERREIENGLEKARKELVTTKISEDAAREYAESMINTIREPLIALDQDLRIVTASRSFYKFFKVKPADTVGQLIYDLGNKQWDIPKLRELLETILPQKTTFDNYEVEHDFVTIGRRIMLLNARQIQRASGKERIILLAIEDITVRREIEARLFENEEKFKFIATHTPDHIAMQDLKLRYTTVINPQFGLTEKEMIGKTDIEIFKKEDAKTLEDIKRKVLAADKRGHISAPLVSLNGETQFFEGLYIPRHDEEGKVNGLIGYLRNVTGRKRIEAVLAGQRQELQAIIDSAPAAISYKDRQNRFLKVNRAFCKMMGMSREKLEGKSLYDIYPEKQARAFWLDDLDVIKKGKPKIGIIEPLSTTGGELWAQTDKIPNFDESGNIIGIISFSVDITASRNAALNLKKFNRTLRAISNSSRALMRAKDEQGFMNKVCEIIVKDIGYKFSWIGFVEKDGARSVRPVAQAGFDTGRSKGSNIIWTDKGKICKPAVDSMRTGKISLCRNIQTSPKYKYLREKAGKAGYSSIISLPLRSINRVFGALTLYSAESDPFSEAEVKLLEELAFDLSYGIMLIRMRLKNKTAERAIKKVAEFPHLNPNPISEIDSSGKIHYMNPAFKKMFPNASKDPFKHMWFKNINLFFWALKGKKKKIIKRDIQVQDSFFLQAMVYMPLEGTIRTYGIDITQRKKAENELKRLYEEMESKVQKRTTELFASKHLADIGTLAATVAHELRNPIGVINVAAYNLRKKIGAKGGDMLKHLSNIEKKVGESSQIINNLLVYSTMKMPQFETTNIYKLLLECAASVNQHFGNKKISFKSALGAVKGLLMHVDPLQIKEVFTNIITNAYQAIDAKKGVVEIRAAVKPGKYVAISVRDTGMGISREDLGSIFKPFFTRKTKGTGLGLVICRDIINMHNGSIDIKSKPGKGSTFTITLPLRKKLQ